MNSKTQSVQKHQLENFCRNSPKTVVWRCSVKKVFLKILQNSNELLAAKLNAYGLETLAAPLIFTISPIENSELKSAAYIHRHSRNTKHFRKTIRSQQN